MTDYYEILRVDPTASRKQIRRAFAGMVLKYHPDRNPPDSDVANIKYQRVVEAFGVLGDVTRRQQYDIERNSDSSTFTIPIRYPPSPPRTSTPPPPQRASARSQPPPIAINHIREMLNRGQYSNVVKIMRNQKTPLDFRIAIGRAIVEYATSHNALDVLIAFAETESDRIRPTSMKAIADAAFVAIPEVIERLGINTIDIDLHIRIIDLISSFGISSTIREHVGSRLVARYAERNDINRLFMILIKKGIPSSVAEAAYRHIPDVMENSTDIPDICHKIFAKFTLSTFVSSKLRIEIGSKLAAIYANRGETDHLINLVKAKPRSNQNVSLDLLIAVCNQMPVAMKNANNISPEHHLKFIKFIDVIASCVILTHKYDSLISKVQEVISLYAKRGYVGYLLQLTKYDGKSAPLRSFIRKAAYDNLSLAIVNSSMSGPDFITQLVQEGQVDTIQELLSDRHLPATAKQTIALRSINSLKTEGRWDILADWGTDGSVGTVIPGIIDNAKDAIPEAVANAKTIETLAQNCDCEKLISMATDRRLPDVIRDSAALTVVAIYATADDRQSLEKIRSKDEVPDFPQSGCERAAQAIRAMSTSEQSHAAIVRKIGVDLPKSPPKPPVVVSCFMFLSLILFHSPTF